MTLRIAAGFTTLLLSLARPIAANVVTDWDAVAVGLAARGGAPHGQREMALVHAAMFDAVSSVVGGYRPYVGRVPVRVKGGASPEAAAAAAAATVLVSLHPEAAEAVKGTLAESLAGIPDGAVKTEGVRIGEAAARAVLDARQNDGADGIDRYRPPIPPGAYRATVPMVASGWPKAKPFGLRSPSQFRAEPPVPLTSPEWAAEYAEVKDLGAKNSTRRSAEQTEIARFWLMTGAPAYHPVARQLVVAKGLGLAESARFMAVFSLALTDAYVAVFDSKYHYGFWRPVTAIRNGDLDGNDATVLDEAWTPIDETPMHPEYPCAHCVQAGAAAAVIEKLLGTRDLTGVTHTSPAAPGVTRRWRDLDAFTEEVAQARIWAGFHYRFSTRAGTAMGRAVGEYVAGHVMTPEVSP